MIKELLNQNIQSFIQENLNIPITQLALKKNPFSEVDYKLILNQIESKNKCKTKLPTWFSSENIIFPAKLSIEQTSSEIAAIYKSNLLNINSLIDITGGFGIDAYYFAKKIKKVTYLEQQEELSKIVSHNYKVLNANNIECFNTDGLEFLLQNNPKVDAIFIDPARRDENAKKVFLWEDCTPNIIANMDKYFEFTNLILIKTSPLFDLTLGIQTLKNVKEIHIVAIENEVKEILWLLEKGFNSTAKTFAINIKKDKLDVLQSQELSPEIEYSLPLKYLYEPNAALMKMADFKTIAHQFKVKKLHPNSHLFTSNELVEFKGRTFEISENIEYRKNTINSIIKGKKLNISTRNFPVTVENIKKQFQIKDGGDVYCFFTTLLNNEKNVLLCKKINELG